MSEKFVLGDMYAPDEDLLLLDYLKDVDLTPAARELVEAESNVPINLNIDRTLRVKITDACGLTCTFCHNEGTPVRTGYALQPNEQWVELGSPRVSIFQSTNGVNFMPGVMRADDDFVSAVGLLKDRLGIDEVHFTGGEPTLHPQLSKLVGAAKQLDLTVKMTSNGENGSKNIASAKQAGLDGISFSIFGTTPEELASVQAPKYTEDLTLAAKKIEALRESVDIAIENGVEVSANVVMAGIEDSPRILSILKEFNPKLNLRILNSLDEGAQSYAAIYELLSSLGAVPVRKDITAGSSTTKVVYQLPNGRNIQFKQISKTRFPDICDDCQYNNETDCKEGFYGTRLYVDTNGKYKVGVCIQRMDLTEDIDEFLASDLPERLVGFKLIEYDRLKSNS